MSASFRRQRGLSLGGLLFGAVVLGVAALLVMKLFPDVTEYFAVVKDVKATAQDAASRDASVSEIKSAYARRAEVDNIKSVGADDLEISKDNGNVVISFAYSKKIPLFSNVSLMIDFEGSSDKK